MTWIRQTTGGYLCSPMSDDMLSCNEIEMLVLKAARGGGLPFGLAEDLSAVAAYLDFDVLETCPCQGAAPQIAVLCAALDRLQAGVEPQKVSVDPALLSAFAAWAQAQSGQGLEQYADGAISLTTGGGATSLGRRSLPPALLAHLQDMAAKTLVPETEASRTKGAGAGLLDND